MSLSDDREPTLNEQRQFGDAVSCRNDELIRELYTGGINWHRAESCFGGADADWLHEAKKKRWFLKVYINKTVS